VRIDKLIEGQRRYRERFRELEKDPGPPPDTMDDPDMREGWLSQRFAALNPRGA
jgi:hypothetical protein